MFNIFIFFINKLINPIYAYYIYFFIKQKFTRNILILNYWSTSFCLLHHKILIYLRFFLFVFNFLSLFGQQIIVEIKIVNKIKLKLINIIKWKKEIFLCDKYLLKRGIQFVWSLNLIYIHDLLYCSFYVWFKEINNSFLIFCVIVSNLLKNKNA